ncbi:GNAT family N-acetyltransferase [Nostoc sp. NIES-2111]
MLKSRTATEADIPALRDLMASAISELQKSYLTPDQIEASRAIMGLDSQLVRDGTYFVITDGERIVGCGGWSRRATAYGGDASPGRDAGLLDPGRDPARVRAMYTHPDFTRRGVGRMILSLCEDAARQEGFREVMLVATAAGRPLYEACGYVPVEHFEDSRGGAPVPLTRMTKVLGKTRTA